MIIELDKLAREKVNVREYGLKAEGLADLIRRGTGKYVVDPGFVIPSSFPIRDTKKLKGALFRLVRGQKMPRLLIARSSDENEAPGIFESHTFMLSPGNWKKCYADFIEACEKVRDSGAGGVVCQMMDTRLSKLDVDYGWDNEQVNKDCFGADRVGFICNSHSRYFENSPVIVSAFGLVNKLVRGRKAGIKDRYRKDAEVSLIFQTLCGCKVINLDFNYYNDHYASYKQKEIDVVFPDNSKEIVSFHLTYPTYGLTGNLFPGTSATTPFNPKKFNPGSLFMMMEDLKFGEDEIEIEGDVQRGGFVRGRLKPHFFQLRKYKLPESRLEKLTEVSSDQLLVHSGNAYVADRFSGDLILLNKLDSALVQEGQIAVARDYRSIIYGLEGRDETHHFVRDLVAKKARALVIPIVDVSHRIYVSSHEVGLMIQELWLLQKDIPVVALRRTSLSNLEWKGKELAGKFPDRIQRMDYGILFKNVTVESDDETGQIYWNS